MKKTLPKIVESANASPPVEIVILNYNSDDDLHEYIRDGSYGKLENGSVLTYYRYINRDYYHMAHARNLSVVVSQGEQIVISSTDIIPSAKYFGTVRECLRRLKFAWLYVEGYNGVVILERKEFIAMGGYDERFEFYGPEDRDLADRLRRRYGNGHGLPKGLLTVIKTLNIEKEKNYRLDITKQEMSKRMRPIYDENVRNNILVANAGKKWGSWD